MLAIVLIFIFGFCLSFGYWWLISALARQIDEKEDPEDYWVPTRVISCQPKSAQECPRCYGRGVEYHGGHCDGNGELATSASDQKEPLPDRLIVL